MTDKKKPPIWIANMFGPSLNTLNAQFSSGRDKHFGDWVGEPVSRWWDAHLFTSSLAIQLHTISVNAVCVFVWFPGCSNKDFIYSHRYCPHHSFWFWIKIQKVFLGRGHHNKLKNVCAGWDWISPISYLVIHFLYGITFHLLCITNWHESIFSKVKHLLSEK